MPEKSNGKKKAEPSLEELGLDAPAEIVLDKPSSKISIDELREAADNNTAAWPSGNDTTSVNSSDMVEAVPSVSHSPQPIIIKHRDDLLTQLFKLSVIGLAFCVMAPCALGVFFLFRVGVRQAELDSQAELEKRTLNSNSDERVIKPGAWHGAQMEFQLERLNKLASQGDRAAYQQELIQGIQTKNYTIFRHGESVFLMKKAPFSGYVKLRRRGDNEEYWAIAAAIE